MNTAAAASAVSLPAVMAAKGVEVPRQRRQELILSS